MYLLMVLLSTLGLSFLGAIAGLAAKDQASAGTRRGAAAFDRPDSAALFRLSDMLAKFAVLVPTTSFQTIFLSAWMASRYSPGKSPAFAVCLMWIVAGYAVFHVFYKKRGMDY